jgi:NADPH:quinone reductase-like Zn-dependent oxidoreductase
VEPNGDQLEQIRTMIEAGDFTANVTATFGLDQVAQAHEMIESGHTRGKIVLTID